MSLWIICLLLFPLFLSAAPKKDAVPPVDPTVVYDTTMKVLRGGTCEVPLHAISPQGYDVKFEILSQPRSGSLSGPQRNSKSSVSYFYTHDGKKTPLRIPFASNANLVLKKPGATPRPQSFSRSRQRASQLMWYHSTSVPFSLANPAPCPSASRMPEEANFKAV